MTEIADAIRKYEARKDVVYGDRERSKNSGKAIKTDVMRTLLVGLDLDIEELNEFRMLAAQAAIQVFKGANEQTGDGQSALVHTLAGTWVDGVVTGLLIAEGRGTHE